MPSTATETELVRHEQQQPEPTEQAAGGKRHGVTVEENGDVVFWALAVDANKKPNRKGFMFKWDKIEDVDVTQLRGNPVLLFLHNDYALPIGTIEQIEVTAREVWMQCRIRGQYDELEPLRARVAAGDVRAVSIGFYVNLSEDIELPKGSTHSTWEGKALLVKSFEIVELSVVPIGAHETALIKQAAGDDGAALSGDIFGPKRIRWDADTSDDGGRVLYRLSLEPSQQATEYTCECIKCGHTLKTTKHCKDVKCPKCEGTMRRKERPGPGEETAPEPDVQATAWKAIPYSRHGDRPKADEGTAWDGPKAVREAEIDDLKIMATIEDTDNLEAKAGYKLPHHQASGKHPVVWRGVAAAMGVLLGARGGVKGVSKAEKKKAHAHLAKEYKRFDKDPPAFQVAEADGTERDYTADELSELHVDGAIAIPGTSAEFSVWPADPPELEAALAEMVGAVREVKEEVEALKAQQTERHGDDAGPDPLAAPDAGPPAELDPGEIAETLRPIVRALLESDPHIRDARGKLVQQVIAEIRRGNAPRR